MINGFEDYTHELTDYELKTLLPLFIEGFKKKVGVTNAVTNKQIIDSLKKKTDGEGQPYKITDARVRKIVNHIRNHNLVEGLVATSKGYYITNDPVELARYIDSLNTRATAILSVKNKMKDYLKKIMSQAA